SWVTDTVRVLTNLTPGTAYEWWVAAYNDYALGADSAKWLFTLPSTASTTSSPVPVEIIRAEDNASTVLVGTGEQP
ncbi:MAG: hypothetical protein JXC32_20425, partial [Anaerolineae bacterium]|nr:hypothetical protein [Anaerolineae bacterium]